MGDHVVCEDTLANTDLCPGNKGHISVFADTLDQTEGLGLGITKKGLPGMEWWVNRTIATVDWMARGVRDWATRVWQIYANDCGKVKFSPLQNVTTGQKIHEYGEVEDEKEERDQQYGGSKEGNEDGLEDDGL
ncbi:unnamed protein product [Allacma fusca]|uniref:Uncharacterized protein n=1 Tax=Allacma fusca TaxID=39272 RepID=A0A8J2KFK2_9HEXA|nr:unnamed protein product [Allacma fusca]